MVALVVMMLARPGLAISVDQIIEKNRATLTGVRDFTCTLSFSVRSTSVRVPDSRATILFKMPDKFKAKPLDGDFAVLPKSWRFALGNVLSRLAQTCDIKVLREESLGGRNQHVLRADERGDKRRGNYHLVWVDAERFTVGVVRSYDGDQKPVTMAIGYVKQGQAWLPNLVNLDATFRSKDQEETLKATLKLTDYKVNVGLTDDQFKDEGK